MQVPDAVYHLMRHTELKTCDLSDNVITKIPPKFAEEFSFITDLNLAHNQMAKLPDECADMASLEKLDISHNTFVSLPNCIFKIPKLKYLNASNNHIVGECFFSPRNTSLFVKSGNIVFEFHSIILLLWVKMITF